MSGKKKEMTEFEQANQRLEHVNRVLKAVRNVNQLIVQSKDQGKLLQDACDCLTEKRGCFNAWIALLDDDRKLIASYESGVGKHFKPMVKKLEAGELPVCIQKVLDGKPVIIMDDPPKSCTDCPLASSYSGRGGITASLAYEGHTYGVLALSVPLEHIQDPEECELIAELASDIGYALNNLRQANDLQKSTRELRQSQERFNVAADAANIGVWDLDIGRDQLIWDERMYEIYGVRKEDFGGAYEAWQQCVHPDDKERAAAEVSAAKQGEKPFDTEFRIIRPDGEVRHIRALAKIIRANDGTPLRMIGTNQDISERKSRELKLQRLNERLAEAQKTSGTGDWMWDAKTDTVTWSENLYAIMGLSADQPVPDYAGNVELYHPDDRELFDRTVTHTLETGEPFSMDLRRTRPDGKEIIINSQGRAELDEDGNVTKLFGTVLDITERVETQARFQMLFENMDSCVAIYKPLPDNSDFEFVDVNPAALKYSQLSREEMIGRNVTEVFPGVKESGVFGALQRVNETGEPETIPTTHYQDDRIEQWVENHVFKLPSGLVVAAYEDTTEKHQAQEALLKSEQRYRRLSENSPAVVFQFRMDKDGSFAFPFITETVQEMMGVSAENVMQDASVLLNKIDPSQQEGFQKAVSQSAQELSDYKQELRVEKEDGALWVEARSDPELQNDGSVIWVGFFQDITERKRAELKLKHRVEYEHLLAAVSAELSGLKIEDIDPAINKTLSILCDYTGSDRAYLFQFNDDFSKVDNTHEYCNEGIPPEIENLKGLCLEEEQPWFNERIRENKPIYVSDVENLPEEAQRERTHFKSQNIQSLIVVPMQAEGNLVGFMGFDAVRNRGEWSDDHKSALQYCSEQLCYVIKNQRSQELLRALETRNQALLDYSPVCHKIIDLNYNLQFMNSRGFKMLALEETDELYGKPYPFDFFPAKCQQELVRAMKQVLETGERTELETLACDAAGNEAWLYHTILPVKKDDGSIDYLTVVSADTTERRSRENELNRFNRFAVDRELRMIELKKEINALLKELGRPEKHVIVNK